MGLKGKLVGQVEISFHGDLYHEIFREKSHHLPSMTSVIHAVDGQWGTQGCTTIFKYTQDGKTEIVEHVMDTIDDEKKILTYRAIKGDVLKSYKSFILTCQVDANGDDNFVTWTVVYEKLKEDIPEPLTYLKFFLKFTKEMDDHHAKSKP